ncbi:polymorphic outer membrane protein middle domain-containing protein [Chlamydia caviae]|uniref:Polymorphic outer membrane protein E/F family protein/autotransporter, putative n=1 Tax=Chlamydia caviae (strain ATCC VR-813 / DSM 19441 / 03DC25 / GPIC) TaxID=227941 RepID=Q823Y1_CHLCV|nr:polymorphic outer membrane protein middle domain-containing protein [Chlamydia caviae]AAP05023.1 polymorphic outer membrane protein E/F family protein/autotransporter, putative [Chlamydia caviae GPIC]
MISDLCYPSMHPYAYPLVCLISLSICAQPLDCFAKEKKPYSFHKIPESGSACTESNFYTGELHNQNADVDITGRKYLCINNQYYRENGGAFTVRSLNITKNLGPIVFRENVSNDNGGAIFSTNCNITYNKQDCCFVNNMANVIIDLLASRSGGAIKSANLVISNNVGRCQFLNNTASLSGGAILADNDINITHNYGDIILRNNKCLKDRSLGGALHSTNCSITSNHAPINFISNQSGGGGAIYATRTCTISYNSETITFLNNCSLDQLYDSSSNWRAGGGVIYCSSCSITNNPKGLIFQNNSAKRDAGVIFAQNLTIKDNGPILFINNSATWGGALQNHDRGQFYLSADYGDIVFKRNFCIKSWGYTRNALHSTPNLNLQIGARQGYSIKFYDPIENEHPLSSVLTFNPESYHLGTVLFSGADVSTNNTDINNLRSKMRNVSKIAHGVLAVEDRAVLAIYKITQDEGTLRLGNGAVITTIQNASSPQTTAGCTLALSKLALNLPSILAKGAEAPKIWVYPTESGNNYTEDPNPTITLSGNLSLLNDDNEDPYDSLNLSRGITRVPFLYLCDNATKKINIDALNIEAINQNAHYGYQGIWSPYWEEYTTITNPTSVLTANTSHRLLYADWTPTGYIPNPEYRGDLVANALWQAAYNTITGLHSTPPPRTSLGVAGRGSVAYVLQKTRNAKPGFELFSRGYSTQASRSTETNHHFALSFSQFYSEIKEAKSQDKVSANTYFAGAQIHIPWFDENLLTSASLGYAYSHNHVKTKHHTTNALSEGDFHSHTLGSELFCRFPEGTVSNVQFRPFIKALGIHAIQESFTETGKNSRYFQAKDPFINVTLPVGVYGYTEHEMHLKTCWEMQLAYTPTIYRKKPKIITTRLVSKGRWITSGTPVDHHAVSISAKNTTTLNRMSLSINYRGDFSKSTLCNFLNITSEINF